MTEEQMKRRLYDRYQLQWMLSHGYSLTDLMRGMTAIPWYHDDNITDYYEDEKDTEPAGMCADIEGIFSAWEFDSDAFNGSCWACFDEFCGAELLDKEYILWLLDEVSKDDDDLRDTYLKWLEDNEEEDEE